MNAIPSCRSRAIPGSFSSLVSTDRLPVPTSTDADTRSPSWKLTRVAFGREPTSNAVNVAADAGGANATALKPAATNAAVRTVGTRRRRGAPTLAGTNTRKAD